MRRNHAENVPGPPPNPLENGGRGPSFRGLEGSGVPLKTDLDRDLVPKPNGLISGAPFLSIFGKNELQIGTPKI